MDLVAGDAAVYAAEGAVQPAEAVQAVPYQQATAVQAVHAAAAEAAAAAEPAPAHQQRCFQTQAHHWTAAVAAHMTAVAVTLALVSDAVAVGAAPLATPLPLSRFLK